MYKKLVLLCSLAVMMISPAYAVDYIPGDVLVVLKPSDPEVIVTASDLDDFGAESFRVASFAAESGAWVKSTFASLSEMGNEIFALIHSDNKDTEELVQELMNNPEVIAASPNYMVHAATVPNDSSVLECWGLSYINAYEAWDITTGSREVYAAIIDSGIDETNPDLAPNIVEDLGRNFVNTAKTPTDDYGHGTHVAGTIGAVGNNGKGIAGINWNVKLIALKALDSGGNGTIEDVMAAVNYVTELIQSGINIRAVNLSLEAYLAFPPTHDYLVQFPLWRAFKALDELNKAVIVVAAGNKGVTIGQPNSAKKYVYPASFQGLYGMISVSAVDQSGSLASFSNRGADISAPGVSILSTWLQSSTANIGSDGVSLRYAQGTSMAAPHVAGAALLMASVLPDSTAYQIRQLLLGGSEEVSASSGKMLDIKAALDYTNTAEARSIQAKGSEWEEYSDYNTTDTTDPQDNPETKNYSKDSGDCNSVQPNIFAMMLILPLAIKLIS